MAARDELLDQSNLMRRNGSARQSHRLPRAPLLHTNRPSGSCANIRSGRELFDDHECARNHIAKSAALRVEIHNEPSQHVTRWGQHIGGPNEVSQGGLEKTDGQAVLAYHPDSEPLFAWRRAVFQTCKEDVVSPINQKDEKNQQSHMR